MKRAFTILILLFIFSASSSLSVQAESNQPIRGIYINPTKIGSPSFNELLSLVNHSDLNTMVIDIKDDYGNLTFLPPKDSPYYSISRPLIANPTQLLQTLQANHIYPIARIVVFKDRVLPVSNPNWSFKTSGGIWKNQGGDSFTNPFLKEVWDYNIGIAILAAKLGFKEIQFDYVRFPEKFEIFESKLIYTKNRFSTIQTSNRIAAITAFVKYAKMKLAPYPVKMSVDVFGNATVIPEAPGIGQNFTQISQNVDVISAMIYPSHWNTIFGIKKPDLEPFRLVQEYAKVENRRLGKLKDPPISRPWIQDFTATWLGKGNYKVYGKKEIEEQIRALQSEGINEFLLWNGSSKYTPHVDYTP